VTLNAPNYRSRSRAQIDISRGSIDRVVFVSMQVEQLWKCAVVSAD